MNAREFSQRIEEAREPYTDEAWWSGRCPAHDDRTPSLGWKDGAAKLLIKCQAGCERAAVLAALDLTEDGTWVQAPRPGGEVVEATYDYRDEAGDLLCQVVRRRRADDRKTFSQRRPDPDRPDQWLPNVSGVRNTLYRLDQFQNQRMVVVVEGEKDADRLALTGLATTCNRGGAGKWRAEHAEQLAAAGVVAVTVVPDGDVPGREHALEVARSCVRAGMMVSVVFLGDYDGDGPVDFYTDGRDVSDFLDARTVDELFAYLFPPDLTVEDMAAIMTNQVDGRIILFPKDMRRLVTAVVTGLAASGGPRPPEDFYAFAEEVLAAPDGDAGPLVGGLALVLGSYITMRSVPWTWPGRIPRGALTLIVGDPDVNKSTFCLDYAARVTTGKPFPDGSGGSRSPESVIFLSTEDAPEYTLMPRFVAMGGDPARIYFQRTGSSAISLKADLDKLEVSLRQTGARHVVVDPVSAYLPDVNTWKDNEVRSALAPLAALADRTGVTVLGIMHLNKKSDFTALQRVMGSTGFVAMARAVYHVFRDPDDPARRLFLNTKMNVAAKPTGLAFRVVPASAGTDPDGEPIVTVMIAWEVEAVTATADEVLQRSATKRATQRPRDEAVVLITDLLQDGPVLASRMEAELDAAGVSARTVKRAKERAGAGSLKMPDGPWYWTPPGFTSAQRAAWIKNNGGDQEVGS